MYYNERVWNEIKSVISHFVLERRKRQLDTLHAFVYRVINFLMKEQKSLQLKSSDIWYEVKSQLAGTEIPHKPLSYDSERFGTISQPQITKILIENFGAKKPSHHGNANSLIFNRDTRKAQDDI